MAERRPLVVKDGRIEEFPIGDTLPAAIGGGGGASDFLTLTDTPGTYGTVGQMLAVNATTNALEWVDAPTGGSGSSTLEFKGFRATGDGSTTQSISVSTFEAINNFKTEDFDEDSAFDPATGTLTIPAAWDGRYMVFSAGVQFLDNEQGTLYIRRNTGAGYETIGQHNHDSSDRWQVTAGPVLVNTGDTFQIWQFILSAATVASTASGTWFTAYTVDSQNIADPMLQTEITATAYSTVSADFGGNVIRRMNNAATQTITVEPSMTGGQPVTFIRTGAGAVTFAAGTGVTIQSAGGNLSIANQYDFATLIPDADTANLYYLIGNLTT